MEQGKYFSNVIVINAEYIHPVMPLGALNRISPNGLLVITVIVGDRIYGIEVWKPSL